MTSLGRSMSLNVNTGAANSLLGDGTTFNGLGVSIHAPTANRSLRRTAAIRRTNPEQSFLTDQLTSAFTFTAPAAPIRKEAAPPDLSKLNIRDTEMEDADDIDSGSTPTNNNAAGTLFGGSAATSQPAATGGLFGAATSQPAATGGLFGSTATQPAATGGLFGSSAAQPAATGGLFGSKPAGTPAPAGGLFGSTAAAAPAPAAGGLFGGAAGQPAATGGLFGAAQPAKPAGTSLFGGAPAATAPPTTSLFGGLGAASNQATQPAAPANSLFGSTLGRPAANTTAPTNSLFGSSIAPAAGGPNGAQSTIPAVTLDWANIKPTTRFNELNPQVQQQLCDLDNAIQLQINQSQQINEFMPRHEKTVTSFPTDVVYLESRLETVQGAIDGDVRATERAKQLTSGVIDDARITFGAIENLRLPSQFHYMPGDQSYAPAGSSLAKQRAVGGALAAAGIRLDDETEQQGSTRDLLAYFRGKVEDLSVKLETYTRHMKEVEEHMSTVEVNAIDQIQRAMIRRQQASRLGLADSINGGGPGGINGDEATHAVMEFKKERLRELAGALRGLEDAILRIAGKVGEAREGVVACQFPGGAESNGGGWR